MKLYGCEEIEKDLKAVNEKVGMIESLKAELNSNKDFLILNFDTLFKQVNEFKTYIQGLIS